MTQLILLQNCPNQPSNAEVVKPANNVSAGHIEPNLMTIDPSSSIQNRLIVNGVEVGSSTDVGMLIDSGAQVDSCSYEWLIRNNLDKKVEYFDKPRFGRGFGGSRHEIMGQVYLRLKIGKGMYNAYFTVFMSQCFRVILGAPFMKQYEILNDIKNKLITVLGADVVTEGDPKNRHSR